MRGHHWKDNIRLKLDFPKSICWKVKSVSIYHPTAGIIPPPLLYLESNALQALAKNVVTVGDTTSGMSIIATVPWVNTGGVCTLFQYQDDDDKGSWFSIQNQNEPLRVVDLMILDDYFHHPALTPLQTQDLKTSVTIAFITESEQI